MHKAQADFTKLLDRSSKAAVGVVFLRSREWERLQNTVRDWAKADNRPFRTWNPLQGWQVHEPTGTVKTEPVKDVLSALKSIIDVDGIDGSSTNGVGPNALPPKTVALMEGTRQWLNPAQGQSVNAVLLYLLQHYARLLPSMGYRLYFSVPETFIVPEELEHDIPVIDLDLPDALELQDIIADLLEGEAETRGGDVQEYTSDEMMSLARACGGLTVLECECAVSSALIDHKSLLPNIPFQSFLRSLMEVKAEAIKSSGFLEVMKPVDIADVAGLDLLKEWIRERAHDCTEAAADFGVVAPRGVTVIGPPGCLAPDTLLSCRRGDRHSGRDIRLDDLYREFNGKAGYGRGRGKWDSSIPTYLHSFDASTGRVFYNRIVSVICAGIKPVYLLTTTAGRQVKLTGDHPVLTKSDGFRPAASLLPGDQIIVRGSMRPVANPVRHGRKPRVIVEGLKHYRSGWDKKVVDASTGAVYHYKRQHRARLVYEAHMNRMSYADYVRRLKTDPEAVNLAALPSDMAVHHMDENPMNDTLSNLCAMFKSEHDRIHNDERKFNVQYTDLDTVESIHPYGRTMTYDIQMESPGNNFALSNGLIVHNTGKTLTATTIAGVLDRAAVRLDFGSLFGGIVGQTEGNIRRALSAIKALGRVVVFCDEIDRVMGMNTTGGDGGVTKRLIGTILTFMQDNDSGAFFVFAANRAEGIDSALIRRGRIDQVFGVNVPNSDERREIIRVHLRKGKQNPDKVTDLDAAVARSKGYVGAEIAGAVQQSISAAFRSKGKVTGAMIAEQLSSIKPLSMAFKEDFDAMAEWASKNAAPASRPCEKDTNDGSGAASTAVLTAVRRRRVG